MKKNLINNTALVFIALLLCKFVAFLQEMIMASKFGANYISDAFNTVYGIKQVVFPMFVVGINQVFLPIYKKKLLEGNDKSTAGFTNYVISVTTLVVFSLVIVIFLFAPTVVNLIAPGFSNTAKQITSELVRLSVLSYILICLSSIVSSMIMAEGHFFVSNFASSLQHICVIAAILVFFDKRGINSLAIALVIGSFLQLIIQLPFVHRGYTFKPTFHANKEVSQQFYRNLPSAFLSSGITQINTLVDRVMASNFSEGSVTVLNYGGRIFTVLLDLCGQVFSTASYPRMIELVVNKEWDDLAILLRKLIETIWLITIPITVFGIIYSKSIVSVIFGHGAFISEKVAITSLVFIGYLISLPLGSLTGLFNHVYFAEGNTKTPMLLNFLTLVINVVLNFLFVYLFGLPGLAVATSTAVVFVFVLRYILLSKIIGNFFLKFDRNLLLVLFVSLLSSQCTFFVTSWFSFESSFAVCIFVFFFGLPLYLGMLYFFKMPLLNEFLLRFKRK